MDDDTKVERTGDEGAAAVVDEASTEPAPASTEELVPHPADEAAKEPPPKHADTFTAVREWVEERFANLPVPAMEQAFKDWVRLEIRLALEGHSEETRGELNP